MFYVCIQKAGDQMAKELSLAENLPALGNHYVWFKNELNKIVWSGLNAPETKCLNVVLSSYYEVLKEDSQAQSVLITFDDMRKRLNYTHNRVNIMNYIKSIRTKLMGWHEFTLNDVETSFVLIPTINIDRKHKFFRFVFNPDLTRLLLFDRENGEFVRYPERAIINLNSVTSMTLYRLLKGFRTTGIAIFTKDGQAGKTKDDPDRPGLWDLLEVKPLMRESDFNKRYLKPAMIDLAPYFHSLDFKKKYAVIKGHRAVNGYVFTFTKEAPDQNENLFGDKLKQHKEAGLRNIKSAKCLTGNEKYKAVDKFLRQKLGTAKKDAAKGIDVFSTAEEIKLLPDDTQTPKSDILNLRFTDKKLEEQVKNASLEQLEDLERSMTKELQSTPDAKLDIMKVNDLWALRRTINQKKNK